DPALAVLAVATGTVGEEDVVAGPALGRGAAATPGLVGEERDDEREGDDESHDLDHVDDPLERHRASSEAREAELAPEPHGTRRPDEHERREHSAPDHRQQPVR